MYLETYESRVEYTRDDIKQFIEYLTPTRAIPIVGACVILASSPYALLVYTLYRLIHSYSKYPFDKTLGVGIGTVVCAAFGLGLIVYYIYIRFYMVPSLINRIGSAELGVLISDYKNGRHISEDRLVFGHRYIIPKGKGTAVRYSETAALIRSESQIKGIEVSSNLCIEKKPKDLERRGGRVYVINEDTTAAWEIDEFVAALRMYAPDAQINI